MRQELPQTFFDRMIDAQALPSGSGPAAWLARLMQTRGFRIGGPLALFAIAVGIVLHDLRDIRPADILAAAAATPAFAILAAATLTAGSYACLVVTEGFALTWLGHALAWRRIATVATTAYAVSNTVGFSLASGGMVRLRMYRADGMSAAQAARVTVLAGAAVSVSGVVLAGLGLAVAALGRLPSLPGWSAAAAALAFMAPACLWFVTFRSRRSGPFTAQARSLALLAALGDWVLSGAALYCLLPHAALSAFPAFVGVFVLGSLLSAASGVPGGLGVFEAIVIALSGLMTMPVHETAAALLLYRLVYGFGPLALACAAALGRTVAARRGGRPAHDR